MAVVEPLPLWIAHAAVKRVVPETCVTVWVMSIDAVARKWLVMTYGSPAVPVPVSTGAESWVNGWLS